MVVKCPKCNHYVSDTVSVCPHCGYDLNSVESSSLNTQEDSAPEEDVSNNEPPLQISEAQGPIVYNVEEQRNYEKYIIPIAIGCILIFVIIIGILSHSPKDSQETLIVGNDSVVEVVDSVAEEPVSDISFNVLSVTSNQETDDINTTVSIDFPQTSNEYLQDAIVSFIINALTNDFTWGENPRPNYHGDLADGQAIADFFVNDKVREISEERGDSADYAPWEEKISIKKVCETDRLVSYEVDFSGSHGGVGGGTTYGATFSKIDCNVICVMANSNDSRLKSYLVRYIHSYLDSDSKEMLDEDELSKHPYPNKEPFVTDKGIRFIYQKYEIGAGALGVVDITIPFPEIAEYMSEDALSLIGYNKN